MLGIHKWEGRYHSIWSWNGGCYAFVCARCRKARSGTCTCVICQRVGTNNE